MNGEVLTAPLLRFGVFELDLRTGELRKSGKLVRLAPQPFKLLVLLASKPGKLVTREEIQREIWGDNTVVDYEQGLSFAVKKARAALGDSSQSPRYIETLPRRGYRFIAPVVAGNHFGDVAVASASKRNGHPAPTRLRWRRSWLVGAGLAALAAVVLTFNLSGLRDRVSGSFPPHIHSIAVLPLENLSNDPKQEYFADGMTDELITELSRISQLRVIGRTSVMIYKGSNKPAREIARELNVDAVIESSVLRSGNRVQINARLVDGSTERVLWEQTFDRDMGDILILSSAVARDVARKVRITVTPEEQQRLANTRPVNPKAFDAYLRGRYLVDRRNATVRSTQYFRKAIDLDPGYAPAYAGLSMSLVSQSYLGMVYPDDVMPRARTAARRALQLNPDLGEAYTALGAIEISYDWDWKAGEQNLIRGIELNPNDPIAEIIYTFYLNATGKRQDAVAHARKAVKLDQLSFFANRNFGQQLYLARRYDAALAQLQRTRELQEVPGVVDNWLSWIYEAQRRYNKAVDADLTHIASMGSSAADIKTFHAAYAEGGWRGYWKARIKYDLTKASKQCMPYMLGISYVRIGEPANAFDWLNRAVDQHCGWLLAMPVDPKLDSLRSDPRFQTLLHRINLPPQSTQAAQAMR